MARKQPGKRGIPAEAETKTKPVRLDLTPDVHRLLRLAAADADMSMASYARGVIEEHLARKGAAK